MRGTERERERETKTDGIFSILSIVLFMSKDRCYYTLLSIFTQRVTVKPCSLGCRGVTLLGCREFHAFAFVLSPYAYLVN